MKHDRLVRLELTAEELTALVAEKHGQAGPGRMQLAFDKNKAEYLPLADQIDLALVGIVFEFTSNAEADVSRASRDNVRPLVDNSGGEP